MQTRWFILTASILALTFLVMLRALPGNHVVIKCNPRVSEWAIRRWDGDWTYEERPGTVYQLGPFLFWRVKEQRKQEKD